MGLLRLGCWLADRCDSSCLGSLSTCKDKHLPAWALGKSAVILAHWDTQCSCAEESRLAVRWLGSLWESVQS